MMALSKFWNVVNKQAAQPLWSIAAKPARSIRPCDRACHAASQGFPSAAVGVVVLRICPESDVPQVLLIHRGKPPARGGLCFPGGRVELGESLSIAAAREVKEETGIDVLCLDPPAPLQVSTPDPDRIAHPRPVTTIDGIYRSDDGELQYHYAIVEMLATVADPLQEPSPADDADSAVWMDVHNVKASGSCYAEMRRTQMFVQRGFLIFMTHTLTKTIWSMVGPLNIQQTVRHLEARLPEI